MSDLVHIRIQVSRKVADRLRKHLKDTGGFTYIFFDRIITKELDRKGRI